MSAEDVGGGGAGGAERGGGHGRGRRPPRDDEGRAIVLGMRRGEAGAFTAFVERYQRLLLRYAQRAGVHGGQADELVTTVLGDVAVALLEPRARIPDDVALFLIVAFRNRFINEQRESERRSQRVREVSVGDDGAPRAALVSEGTRRASRGLAWDDPPRAPAGLTALARMLSESLSDDERQMLAWDSEDVPQREIAEHLGITHAAVRQRLRRLKERLRAAAERYAAALDGDSGRVVRRFLRRSLDAPHDAERRGPQAGRARQRRAEPTPLADGAGHETQQGGGGPSDE